MLALLAWFVVLLLSSTAEATTTYPDGFQNPRVVRYGAKDDAGHGLDTLKIAETGSSPKYVGLSHLSGKPGRIHVDTSDDLMNWTFVRDLGDTNGLYDGHDPTIQRFGDSFMVAFESGSCLNGGRCIRVQNWLNLTALESGSPYVQTNLPRTLGAPVTGCEGTPDFVGTAAFSSMVIGFHYNGSGCPAGADQEARGLLQDFGTSNVWTTSSGATCGSTACGPDNTLMTDMIGAGVLGSKGDRDDFNYNGDDWTVTEGNTSSGTTNDPCAWRTYGLDRTTNTFQALPINTGGANSQANPTTTMLTLPDGSLGAVATTFIQGGSGGVCGAGKSGEAIWYWPLNPPAQSPMMAAAKTASRRPSRTAR